jgi:hypothetical protein
VPSGAAAPERHQGDGCDAAEHAGAADSLIVFGSSLAADPPPVRQPLELQLRSMRLAQFLFVIAAAIFFLLGVAHAVLTIRDLRDPRSFTPTDDKVREAMIGAHLRFAPATTIWRAWLGFNLSHSLGLLVFGGLLGGLALYDFRFVAGSTALQVTAVVVAGIYALLAVRFWFAVPAAATAFGALAFLASAVVVGMSK